VTFSGSIMNRMCRPSTKIISVISVAYGR
jgi:hypothetical protein